MSFQTPPAHLQGSSLDEHGAVGVIDVESSALKRILGRVADSLERDGVQVRRYPDAAALRNRQQEWAQLAVLLCDGTFKLDEAFLARARRLRGVLSAITGTEGFDQEIATRHGVLLGNGAVAENWRSMAESTVLMMLATLYGINDAQAVLRVGRPRPPTPMARMAHGRCIGFLGFGRIAAEVARLLHPWALKMLCSTRSDPPDLPEHVQRVPLNRLFEEADILVVLAPLNQDSAGLVSTARLATMRPGAHVVVMSRGGIVDEAALAEAIAQGRIGGAALDAFAVEPLPADSPLRHLPGVVLTPHMIGHTAETIQAIEDNALEGVRRLLAWDSPRLLLNPAALPVFQDRARETSTEFQDDRQQPTSRGHSSSPSQPPIPGQP